MKNLLPFHPSIKQSLQETSIRSHEPFQARISNEFIKGSAIVPDLFAPAIEFIEDTGYWEPNRALNHRIATQWKSCPPHNFGTIAAFKNEDDTIWQAKPENPRYDSKKEQFQKYETPVAQSSRAFLPAVSVQVWYKVAQRFELTDQLPSWVRTAHQNGDYMLKSSSTGFGVNSQESSFWQWVEQHPEISIIITEGGKKSLCLLSQGYAAIALYGCWGGVIKNDRIAGEKIAKLKPELISDLQPFAVPGRKFCTAFDQDTKLKARDNVTKALLCMGWLLTQLGCDVEIATWDKQDGKGIDDLIVNRSVAAWEKSYSEAISFTQWSIAQRLAREIRRKPDLDIGDREFIEIASELPREGIVALVGGKGSGKSKAIGESLKSSHWLSITHLNSLGRDQAAGWSGVFVNDGDRHGSKLLKDGMPVDGGSVCVPSLLKVQAVKADVLVLDEVTVILEFLLGSKLANKDGSRPLLLSELHRRIKSARLVWTADADLTEEVLQYIESIRGEKAYLVRSKRQALTYEATVIDGSKNAAIALLRERIEQVPKGKIIYINTDSKTLAETFAELLGRSKTLLITGDTSSGNVESSFLASKGRDLPQLALSGIRFIVSSPSVTQGFSIEHHTNLIDSVWGFYTGCSIAAHSIAQAPDRVRDSSVPRFFWIAKKGSAYSQLSKAQSIKTFLKEFRQLSTTAARLVAQSLTPEAIIATEEIDWQSENLRMLGAIEVRRNRGMSELRETLIALLRKEGKRVSIVTPNHSKAEIKTVATAVSSATETVKNRHIAAVAAAETITKEAAEALSEQADPLTPEQVLSLEKFYIAEFYRLESVTNQDVLLDRKGRTRLQVKALEAVLSPRVATEATAKSINQNSENPQDWNSVAVRTWLLEQSGAATLIREIVAGTVVTLCSEPVVAIAQFIRSHPTEFRIAFNFARVTDLTDQQIVGEMLQRHGIKTKRRGNKNNRRYEVCKPELETILTIIERRKSALEQTGQTAISPPQVEKVDQTGAIVKLLTEEDRQIIREWWKIAKIDPVQRRYLEETFPIEVIQWAIA